MHLQNNTRDASICVSGLVLSNPSGSGEHSSMAFLSVLLLDRSTRQFYFHTHLSSNKLSLFFRSIIYSVWLLFVSFDLVAFCLILKHYIIVVLNQLLCSSAGCVDCVRNDHPNLHARMVSNKESVSGRYSLLLTAGHASLSLLSFTGQKLH